MLNKLENEQLLKLGYADSRMKDINRKSIFEGSVINANGYNSDIKNNHFHCIMFEGGVFGCDIYSDFEPISSYQKIEVLAHCTDFIEVFECEEWEGNLGSVMKK